MPAKKRITAAERRHQDNLRRKTLRVASIYETRLATDRRRELRRVLALAKDYTDPVALVPLLSSQLDETAYLGKWWTGLITDAGLPIAKSTARDLLQAKAAEEEDIWLTGLRNYATARAGQEIVVVTGTWKDTLVRLVRQILAEDFGQGIEKITKELYTRYLATIEKWQCRRIAQTEAMIGMAEAANEAAQTLSIHYTKEWCISGLGNTRSSHEAMDGTVVDEDEPFVLPGGIMMYPHDTSMNPDASEIINCACTCIRRPKRDTEINGVTKPDSSSAEAGTIQNQFQGETVEEMDPERREERILEMMNEMDSSLSEETRRAIAENNLLLEDVFRITKGEPMSIEDADLQKANPNFYLSAIYQKNCATCAPAFILRERGFDITAKGKTLGSMNQKAAAQGRVFTMWKNVDGTKAKPELMSGWMKKKGYKRMTDKRYEEFFQEKTKQPGRYIFSIRWKGNIDGHASVFIRGKDGKLFYVEPQEYLSHKGVRRSIKDVISSASAVPSKSNGIMRVDDKLFDTYWADLFNTK